jgi:carboxypeptidase family protein
MKRQLASLAVAFALLTTPLYAQQSPGAQKLLEAAAPAPGNVTLSLDEYNRLLALANRPQKKSDAPPMPYVLKTADLKLHVVNDDVLGSIQFEGETLGTNSTKVPLTSGMTILDARHGARPLPLLLENGMHIAILPGDAEFNVSLDAGLPIGIETGRASFNLPAPAAGSVRLSLTVPGERTNVELSPGLITHRASVGGNTEIEATLAPGQVSHVWWNTREVVAPVTPRAIRFLSDVKSLVSVTESDLQIAALVDVKVVQGEAQQFSVAIPYGFEVTAVNGPSLESSEEQNGVLQLKIAQPPAAAHQFLISMQRPLSDNAAPAPILTFKDAQRETGEVLVEGQGTLELTAKESGGLKRLDIKEVNPYLRALSRYPLQAAFRYHRQAADSPALALDWTRFPDSSVLAAIAERATVTTLVTNEGKSLTEVKLIVKNQAQPFLRVALPAGATILTADVAGEKVKPVQGADGDRVPLLRSGFHPAGPYTVSFVFEHSGAPFAKKGDGDISLPRMDVPIGFLEWELFLPEQFKVKDFSGDAIAESLFPNDFDPYVEALGLAGGTGGGTFRAGVASGSFQAGIGRGYAGGVGSGNGTAIGSTAGSGVVNPLVTGADTNDVVNGRNVADLVTLVPGADLAPGDLGGQILSPTGAVIADAHFQLRNLSTGATTSGNTDQNGDWTLSGLPSGTYELTASANGVQALRTNIAYDAANPLAYRMILNVGSLNQEVSVQVAPKALALFSRPDKKHKSLAAPPPPPQASVNVFNLQQRVAGVLPVAVEVPRTGTSYRFLRPLIVDEETKLTFTYKSK